MSDRCSKQWDEACDVYLQANQDIYWPNLAAIDVQSQKKANHFLQYNPTTGDNMIRNSVEKNLFVYPASNIQHTPFDPNMASSPIIPKISVNSISPAWDLHPVVYGNIHNDNVHVNMMLKYPRACFDLLARFHQIHKSQPMLLTTIAGGKSNSNLTTFLNANNKLFTLYNQ
jgi:hypothetical protein